MTGADYVVTQTTRAPGGWVTYQFTTLDGRRRHVTVPYRFSTPDQVDPIIANVINYRRPLLPLA